MHPLHGGGWRTRVPRSGRYNRNKRRELRQGDVQLADLQVKSHYRYQPHQSFILHQRRALSEQMRLSAPAIPLLPLPRGIVSTHPVLLCASVYTISILSGGLCLSLVAATQGPFPLSHSTAPQLASVQSNFDGLRLALCTGSLLGGLFAWLGYRWLIDRFWAQRSSLVVACVPADLTILNKKDRCNLHHSDVIVHPPRDRARVHIVSFQLLERFAKIRSSQSGRKWRKRFALPLLLTVCAIFLSTLPLDGIIFILCSFAGLVWPVGFEAYRWARRHGVLPFDPIPDSSSERMHKLFESARLVKEGRPALCVLLPVSEYQDFRVSAPVKDGWSKPIPIDPDSLRELLQSLEFARKESRPSDQRIGTYTGVPVKSDA